MQIRDTFLKHDSFCCRLNSHLLINGSCKKQSIASLKGDIIIFTPFNKSLTVCCVQIFQVPTSAAYAWSVLKKTLSRAIELCY